jgi:hypothetical protein
MGLSGEGSRRDISEGLLGGPNAKVNVNVNASVDADVDVKDKDMDKDNDVDAAMQIDDGTGVSLAGWRMLIARSGMVRGVWSFSPEGWWVPDGDGDDACPDGSAHGRGLVGDVMQ